MVLLHSEKIPLGQQAASFRLPAVDGKVFSLDSFKGSKGLLLMFICNHCPYVQAVEDRIIQLERDYGSQGIQLVGICSNDPTDYPDDAAESLKKRWKEKDYRFPYLIDEDQDVARSYGVVCTPEFFLFNGQHKLVYHGQLDDHWKDARAVKRQDLREAIEAVLAKKPPLENQIPSMGCSIKWKKTSV